MSSGCLLQLQASSASLTSFSRQASCHISISSLGHAEALGSQCDGGSSTRACARVAYCEKGGNLIIHASDRCVAPGACEVELPPCVLPRSLRARCFSHFPMKLFWLKVIRRARRSLLSPVHTVLSSSAAPPMQVGGRTWEDRNEMGGEFGYAAECCRFNGSSAWHLQCHGCAQPRLSPKLLIERQVCNSTGSPP